MIIMTDSYNCSGDYRDACTLVDQGLSHISLKSPRARRLYPLKLLLENGCYHLGGSYHRQFPNNFVLRRALDCEVMGW